MGLFSKIGLGGGLIDGLGKGSKSNNKGELQNLLRDMLNIQREGFAVQGRDIRQGNAAALQGYGSAFNDVNRAERAGAEDIAYQSQAGRQAAQGAAAQRGYSGGSVGTNLGLATARDTRRAISDLQMNLSRQRTGLQVAQGQQKQQNATNLAQFEAYKANNIVNTLMPYFQHQSSKLLQKQGAGGANLAGFGQLAGLAIGGGIGGPVGAAAGSGLAKKMGPNATQNGIF